MATGVFNQAHKHADCFYKHLLNNGSLSGAQWVPAWYRDRMSPLWNKSRREISSLRNIPQSGVSGIYRERHQLSCRAVVVGSQSRVSKYWVASCTEIPNFPNFMWFQISSTVWRELYPWISMASSCNQAIHHRVQCKASDAVFVKHRTIGL